MTRSNGPATPAGRWPAQNAHPASGDPRATTAGRPAARWPDPTQGQPQGQQPAYPYPQQGGPRDIYGQPAPQAFPYPEVSGYEAAQAPSARPLQHGHLPHEQSGLQAQGYAQSPANSGYPEANSATRHAYGGDPGYAQHNRSPQSYPGPGTQQEYLPEQAFGKYHAHASAAGVQADPSMYAPQPDPRTAGYAQWPSSQPGHHEHGYDLGHYGQPAQQAHDPLAHQGNAAWGQADPFATHGGAAGYDATAGYALDPNASGDGLEAGFAHDEDGDYELEEPRRGRSKMLMAAAVVGLAIAGGGLALGYSALFGTIASDGATPVIKGETGPSKTKPSDPGGKQFAHTDSKIMGRLSDSTGTVSAATADEADSNGSRKVQTLVVGRDGVISSPAVQPEAAPAAEATAPPSTGVPGLTLVDGFGGRPTGLPPGVTASPPAEPVAQKPVVTEPPAAPTKPIVIARTTPEPPAAPVANEPPATVSTKAPAASEPARAPAQKKAPSAAPAAADSGAGNPANGFVAVLASVPASSNSRIDALKRFADMQQKYGPVLQNKTPDVQEANLGEKGTYHRLLVGPPGSREQASALCSELKTSGYADCWVKAY